MSQVSLFDNEQPVHRPTRDFVAGILAYHGVPASARERKLTAAERAALDGIATVALRQAQDALKRLHES